MTKKKNACQSFKAHLTLPNVNPTTAVSMNSIRREVAEKITIQTHMTSSKSLEHMYQNILMVVVLHNKYNSNTKI